MIGWPVLSLQGRGGPERPSGPKGDPDKPRGGGGGGRQKPAGHQKPGGSRPANHRPAPRKPAAHRPADHKPAAHKKTAGRGELDVWFDEVEFRPLATGGHH